MRLNSRGVSMIQTVIAIGVMSVMVAGTSRMFVSQAREIQRLRLAQDIQAHISELQTALTSQEACENGIGGGATPLNEVELTDADGQEIAMNVGGKNYVQGAEFGELRVENLNIRRPGASQTLSGGDVLHQVNLFAHIRDATNRGFQYRERFVGSFYILENGGVIQSCVSGIGTGLNGAAGVPPPPTCSETGEVLQWNGSQWQCIVGSVPPPPSCSGSSRALQWTGSAWRCVRQISECRVCIQLTSNSDIDGDKECSSFSSRGNERYTGMSGWAEAKGATYGGGKYRSRAWIECR